METIESALTKIGIGRFHYIFVFIMGIVNACDGMEMLLLAFLGPLLMCSWRISSIDSSILTTGAFGGMMFGAIILGKFSDRYGRKTTLIVANVGLAYFGLLSSLSPTIMWMTIMRIMIGIFIGANNSMIFAFVSEVTPLKYRGAAMIFTPFFWAIGCMIITLLCYYVTPAYGWRVFLCLVTIPIAAVLLSFIWIPESPRYLLLHNEKEKCLEAINQIAKINHSPMVFDIYEAPVAKSTFLDLIHSNYFSTTILTCLMWFISGLSYYSTILILTVINGVPHRCLQNMTRFSNVLSNTRNNIMDDSCCMEMTWKTYENLLISSAGEIIYVPISFFLIYTIERKTNFALNSIIISVGFLLLNLCMSRVQMSILCLILRGALRSVYVLNYIYASEVFPTSARGLGIGLCSAHSCIGAMISPFLVNQVIVEFSFFVGTMILFSLNLFILVVSFILPHETKSRQLLQTAEDTETLDEKPNYETINKK